MAAEHEIEELQLQLESKVCGLGVDALAELADHLQVETKELRRLALLKKIREKIEQDVSEGDDKKTLLVGLIAFVDGKPPPLEDDATEDKPAKVNVQPLNSKEKATEKAQGAETKVNVDVSRVLRREFKIHGVVAAIILRMGCRLLVWRDR